MCGIFGYVNYRGDPRRILKLMGDAQAHRGPDGEGSFFDEKVALGMRRLSIIDLAHGNQPFFSADGSVVVFCNGEIYNYVELRAKLSTLGYSFKTSSDIEILPHLYVEYGMDFVHYLNGMYAICLYDRKTGVTHLVRDRLGVKPLYYAMHEGSLLFASEIKSLLALGVLPRDVDHDALSAYLELMYVPAPLSPFRSIRKLLSGCALSLTDEGIGVLRYWEPKVERGAALEEARWVERTSDLLRDSIRLQMRSDVPVGSYLSGGIDSSGVTALAAELTDAPLDTFHLSWKGVSGKIDETAYAALVAKRYGARHHVKTIDGQDMASLIPRLVHHLEEPLADAAFVPTFVLAEHAARRVKVILSGAGGDELFAGYLNHRRASPFLAFLGKILYDKAPYFSPYDCWKPKDSAVWKKAFDWFKPSHLRPTFDEQFRKYARVDRLNARLLVDMTYYMQDDILLLTDKMTMAASLECRVPLLDHRIVELSLTMPPKLKIRGNDQKFVLKECFKNLLPPEILRRGKEGFGVPVEHWIGRNKKAYDECLLGGALRRELRISEKFLVDMTRYVGKGDYTVWNYWKLLILAIWLEVVMQGRGHEDVCRLS